MTPQELERSKALWHDVPGAEVYGTDDFFAQVRNPDFRIYFNIIEASHKDVIARIRAQALALCCKSLPVVYDQVNRSDFV